MKKTIFIAIMIATAAVGFSQRTAPPKKIKYPVTAATETGEVPPDLQGNWMYGHFSTKEYWSVNPGSYLGNAFQFAIAFKFNGDGTYEQYFTSSTVTAGASTFHQSLTKGRVVIDTVNHSITTYPASSHYKRTRMGKIEEDRDMLPKEVAGSTLYTYKTGFEPGGSKAIYLTLQGTTKPLAFLKRF